jgi:small-conductance mechanosensitive channel
LASRVITNTKHRTGATIYPFNPARDSQRHQVQVHTITDAAITPRHNPPALPAPARPVPAHQRGATAQDWLHRAWITLKVLAVLTAVAAAGAVIYLVVLAVMAFIAFMIAVVAWIHAHLLAIGVVGAALFFFGGGSAVCAGIHCGGCRG